MHEVNKFLQHSPGKGMEQSKGAMPLIKPLSNTGHGGWELRLLWVFLRWTAAGEGFLELLVKFRVPNSH